MSRWSAGNPVTVREIWQGKVWTVRALTIVRDEPDLLPGRPGSVRGAWTAASFGYRTSRGSFTTLP